MEAEEILSRLIARVLMVDRYKRPGKPGEVVQSLPEEQRTILSGLRSDDIGPDTIRRDLLWVGNGTYRERTQSLIREECLKFDKKLRG